MKDELLTIKEAAEFFGVSTRTLIRWEEKGVLKSMRTVGNQRRYSKEHLANLFKSPQSASPTQTVTQVQIEPDTLEKPQTNSFSGNSAEEKEPSLVRALSGGVLAGGAMIGLLILSFIFSPKIGTTLASFTDWLRSPETSRTLADSRAQQVLGTTDHKPNYQLFVNVPSVFKLPASFLDTVTIKKQLTVSGVANLNGGIKTNDKDINAGKGKLTASNVIYSLLAGTNVSLTGDPQNPTISATGGVTTLQGLTGALNLTTGSGISLNGLELNNTGVTSFQGQTGTVTLSGGSGISVSGTTIDNTDAGSTQNIFKIITAGGTDITAGSNNDQLTFAAGSGITLTGDANSKKITITGTPTGFSGLTTDGILYATSATTVTSTNAGTNGYILKSNGPGIAPTWEAPGTTLGFVPFDQITSGTNTAAAMIVGSGASFGFTGTGTINASSLNGATFASPGAIGSTTPGTGAFTTLTGSTFNGLTITNTGTNTLTIATGKTVTVSNTLTLAGTDGTSFTFPSSSGTVVTTAATQTLTNKTIAAGSNTITGLTNTNLSGSAGITNANLANSSITVTAGSGLSGGGVVSLGGSVSLANAGVKSAASGTGISIDQSTGDITITNNGVTSAVAGTGIGVSGGTGAVTITNNGVTSLAGTANQVSVTGATGSITLSLPQNIHSGASPTFAGLLLSGFTNNGGVVYTNGSGTFAQTAVGSGGECLKSAGGGSPTWGACAAANYFQRNGTSISPATTGDSLLLADSGTTSNYRLEVNGKQTGKALAVFNETGNQAIFTASASGATRFTIANNGNVTATGTLSASNFSGSSTGSNTGDVTLAGQNYLSIAGQIITANAVNLSGTNVTSTLGVGNGGTGVASLTSNGVLFGGATVGATTAGTDGQILLGRTGTSPAFGTVSGDGTIGNTGVFTLKNTGPGAGSLGTTAAQTPVLTLDAQGRITSVSNTSIAIDASQITSGNLAITRGGTNGSATPTAGAIAYGTGTAYAFTLAGSSNQCLLSAGAGTPTWGTCALGTNYLQRNSTTISPFTTGDSFLLADAGTTSSYRLEVNGKQTGKALAVFNETGNQDIFTASASGSTKFTIENSGNILVNTTSDTTDGHKVVIKATDHQLGLVNSSNNVWGIANWNGTNGLYYQYNSVNQMYLGPNGSLELATNLAGSAYSPLATLDVRSNSGTTPIASFSGSTAIAGLIVDQSGVGDIFTASKSGATKFTINNAGNVVAVGSITASNFSGSSAGTNTGDVSLAGQSYLSIAGQTITANAINLSGTHVTSTLGVGNGGTGVSSLTTNGVLFGGATVGATTAGTDGQLLLGRTGTSPAFGTVSGDGTITNTGVFSLKNTGPGAGSLGTTAAQTPVLTLDAQGRIVSVSNTSIAIDAAAITSGTLPINRGGTNATATPTAGAIAYGTGTAYAFTLAGSSNQCLLSAGAGTPTWGTCALGTNYWQKNSTTLAPLTTGDSLLLADSGTTSSYRLEVNGKQTGKALAVLNETGNQDIFSASASGVTRFTIANNGNVTATGVLSASNFSGSSTGTNTGDVTLAGQNYLSIAGQVITANAINLSGTHVTSTLGVGNGGTGTATTFTQGSLVFAGASGVYSQNNSNFFWDNSALRLGIGTASPLASLDIRGTSGTIPAASVSATSSFAAAIVDNSGVGDLFTASKSGATKFVIANSGNTGIGVANPVALLQVGAAASSATPGFVFAANASSNVNGNASFVGNWQSSNLWGIGPGTNVNGDNTVRLGQTSSNSSNVWNPTQSTRLILNGSLGTSALAALDVGAANATLPIASFSGSTNFAAAVVDQSGNGDIFTASKSGATKFTINNAGNVVAVGSLTASNFSGSSTGTNTGDVTLAGQNYLSIAGQTITANAINLSGTNVTSTLGVGNGGTGTATTFTQGSLVFAGASGVYAQNNSNFFWDNTNLRFGIGTASPLAGLDVRGTSATTPAASVSANSNFAGLVVDNRGSGDLFTASSSGLSRFTVKQNGNVLIGLTTDTADGHKLAIKSADYQLGLVNASNNRWGLSNWDGTNGLYYQYNGINQMFLSSGGSLELASLGGSSYSPLATLDVRANSLSTPVASFSGSTGKATLTVDQSDIGDIFTASKSGATKFVINNAGNVGIGTSTPTAMLHVAGNALFKNTSDSTTAFQIQNAAGSSLLTADTINKNLIIGERSQSASAWAQSYNGAKTEFDAMAVYNGYLYAGQGNATGDGDILVFDGTSWSTSLDGTQEDINSFAVFNGKLYAGQGETGGDGDIFVCNPATAGNANICDNASDWTTAYNGAQEGINALAVYNGKLYAGQSTDTGDGDVLVCNPATAGNANDCDNASDWTTSYNGSQESISVLAVYNGKLYAGQGSSTGDGDVLVFDGSSWTTAMDGAQEEISAFAVYNGKLYAGQGSSANGDGDIFVCDPQKAGDTNTCDNASDWTTSFAGSTPIIRDLAVYNGKLYAGQGDAAGQGDVLVYDGSTWTTSYDGAQESIITLAEYNSKLYGGQGNGSGDGDIYTYTEARTTTVPLVFRVGSGTSQQEGSLWFENEDSYGNPGGQGGDGVFKLSHSLITTAGAYDVAEDYSTRDETLAAGDLVAADPNESGMVKKASGSADAILGVYSEKPGLRLSQTDSSINGGRAVPIALAGRVPVKVSARNGAIKSGDALTMSDTPGVAVKAIHAGPMIGRALAGYSNDDPASIGKVMTFINLSWYDPGVTLSSSGNITLNGQPLSTDTLKLALDETNLHVDTKVSDLEASTSARLASVDDKFSSLSDRVATLEANTNLLASGSALLNTQPGINSYASTQELGLDKLEAKDVTVSNTLSVIGRTMLSDVGITGKVNIGLLSIDGLAGGDSGDNSYASINTSAGPLKLQSDGYNGIDLVKGNVTIDTSGNVKTKGEITAKKINIDTKNVQSASLGTGTLSSGMSKIVIHTTAVTDDSKIFITPKTATTLPLSVTSQKDGDSFTVEMAAPATKDVKFNWWIIN